MGHSCSGGLYIAGVLTLITGCASVTPLRGTADIDKMIATRGAPSPAWPQSDGHEVGEQQRAETLLSEPLSLERAVELAFLRNPEIRVTYAELGIAQADVLAASRLGNPTLGYINLAPQGGGRSQITRSISLGFTDLLLLPARARLARAAFESTRERVGAALLELQARVETAWFEYVNLQQVAEMRGAVARALDSSAEYAQRLRDAGNITPRNFALELASASEAQVDAARARAQVVRARTELAELMGVSSRGNWQVPQRLPAPLAEEEPPAQIVDDALASRLDVSAARRDIGVLEGGLRLTRRWRWLGDVEVGYERESETDGARLRGPTLSVGVPIFNQNQSGVFRAQAQLEAARARLSALELSVRNDVVLGLDRLAASKEIAENYRTALVPQREAVVKRTQEEFNFMLTGAFELIQAKREQFDAYQEYLEAVRDYWIARVELRRAAGGRLPDDEAQPGSTIGVEELLKPNPDMKGMDGMEGMEGMDHSSMDSSQMNPSDGDQVRSNPTEQPNDDGDQR